MSFIFGIVIGACLGVFVTALVAASKYDEE